MFEHQSLFLTGFVGSRLSLTYALNSVYWRGKEKNLIIYEGVPYSSYNDTLAYISSLIAHSRSNRVKD